MPLSVWRDIIKSYEDAAHVTASPDIVGMSEPYDENAAETTSRLIYDQLPNTRRQIRLLKVKVLPPSERQNGEPELDCTLHTVDTDDGLPFWDCLSYAWGHSTKRVPITLNGHRYAITVSLYEALRLLHQKGAIEKFIWADALCINQHDTIERGHQVSFMGKIYAKARMVHLWLGPETPHTSAALEAMSRLVESDSDDGGGMTATEVVGCADLMGRPWCRRLWVVQEAVLARKRLAHVGQHTVHPILWARLRHGCVNQVLRVEGQHAVTEDLRRFASSHWLAPLGLLSGGRVGGWQDAASWRRSTAKVRHESITEIGELMTITHALGVTDPRDKIYALLALLPQDLDIQVSYDVSSAVVRERVTIALINRFQRLQCFCWAGYRESDSMPSWYVRYDRAIPPWAMSAFACRLARPKIGQLDSAGRLPVALAMIDDINSIGSRCEATSDELEADPGRLISQSCCWWCLASSLFPEERQLRDRLGFRLTAVVSGSMFCRDSEDLWTNVKDWITGEDASLHTDKHRLRTLSGRPEFCDAARSMAGSTFFVTGGGKFGICPASIQEGDKVAIIAGVDVPFVLRPFQREAEVVYRLIGLCYCEGIMWGDALPQLPTHGHWFNVLEYGFKMITLV